MLVISIISMFAIILIIFAIILIIFAIILIFFAVILITGRCHCDCGSVA